MLLRKIRFFIHIVICGLIWHGFVFFQPAAYSEDSLGDTIDCTDVNVYYVDDPNLTHEERLRLMDKAFWESLNKFEMCQSAKEMAKAAAAMDGDGEMGSSGASIEETGGTSASQSAASSTMSGTQAPENIPPAEGTVSVTPSGGKDSQDKNETNSKTGKNMNLSNGKLPEDIPSAQNDDALAAQIRYAAENETDPVKSRQLWNEYRKYKGLPTK